MASFLRSGKDDVEIGEVVFLDGAAGDELAVCGEEAGGEVFEEEREFEGVVDVEGGEDVEVVLDLIAADEQGLGFDDGVEGVDIGVGDGDLGTEVGVDVLVEKRRRRRETARAIRMGGR